MVSPLIAVTPTSCIFLLFLLKMLNVKSPDNLILFEILIFAFMRFFYFDNKISFPCLFMSYDLSAFFSYISLENPEPMPAFFQQLLYVLHPLTYAHFRVCKLRPSPCFNSLTTATNICNTPLSFVNNFTIILSFGYEYVNTIN